LSAVRALGYTNDRRAVEPLLAALKDEDLVFRGEAALSLIRLGDFGVEALLATFDEQSLAATVSDYQRIIREGQDSSLPILVAALMKAGNISMDEDYLNCGQNILSGAAGVWADMNGFYVMQGSGGGSGASWGGQ
ncbi:MAG: HEAT repeat domain-containing protein, partial [Chloroflexota bacterium]